MLLNRIRPVLDPLLRKNQNGFRQNRSTTGQILTIRRIIEEAKSKKLPATLLFIDFSKAFDSIHRGKMREILTAYGLPEEIVKAIYIVRIKEQTQKTLDDNDITIIIIKLNYIVNQIVPILCGVNIGKYNLYSQHEHMACLHGLYWLYVMLY